MVSGLHISPGIGENVGRTVQIVSSVSGTMNGRPSQVFLRLTKSIRRDTQAMSQGDHLRNLCGDTKLRGRFRSLTRSLGRYDSGSLQSSELFLCCARLNGSVCAKRPLGLSELSSSCSVSRVVPRTIARGSSLSGQILMTHTTGTEGASSFRCLPRVTGHVEGF